MELRERESKRGRYRVRGARIVVQMVPGIGFPGADFKVETESGGDTVTPADSCLRDWQHRHRHRHRQTDRHRYRYTQTDRHTQTHTDTQTHRHTDTHRLSDVRVSADHVGSDLGRQRRVSIDGCHRLKSQGCAGSRGSSQFSAESEEEGEE
eukprot:2073540-Rhodomonas_salina.1